MTIEFALLVPVIVAVVSFAASVLLVGTTDAQAHILTEVVAQQSAAGLGETPELARLQSLGAVSVARNDDQACVSWRARHSWLAGVFVTTSGAHACRTMRP